MIELIPAIDVIDGKCVRLSQGDYQSKKVYNENPVEVAHWPDRLRWSLTLAEASKAMKTCTLPSKAEHRW